MLMISYIVGSLLVVIGLGALALQRLYSSVPTREFKRLAARGDQLARLLYRPTGYGANLRLLLWLVLALSWSGGLLLLVRALPAVYSLGLLVILSVIGFVWLPSLRLTQRNATAAAWCATPLAWALAHLHPVLDRITRLVQRHRNLAPHSRLYETEDLLELLEQQKEQVGNRINPETLDLAIRSITFDDRQAAAIVHPRTDTHLVNADQTIGPVLLDQLHQAGQSSFLVYKDSEENIVGSLNMSDAVRAKHGGRVFDLMRSDLAFVHEDFSLRQVLSAFQKTGQRLLVVLNAFEEFVGVVTIDGLLHELLGEAAMDADVAYEDRSAIAAYKPAEPQETAPPEEAAEPEAAEPNAPQSNTSDLEGTAQD